MSKVLQISFKTIQKKARKEDSFATKAIYREEIAIIKNLPDELLQILKQTAEVIIDKANRTMQIVRNAQIEIPMKLLGYAKNILLTFAGGQLTAVLVE